MVAIEGRAIPDVITNRCKKREKKPPETRTFCFVFKEVNNQYVFVSRKHAKNPNLVFLQFHFTHNDRKLGQFCLKMMVFGPNRGIFLNWRMALIDEWP